VGTGQVRQGIKAKVVDRRPRWWLRRAPPLRILAAVDPGAGETGGLSRGVIVKKTLRGVQDLPRLDPEALECC
jgi:hypothetical protein